MQSTDGGKLCGKGNKMIMVMVGKDNNMTMVQCGKHTTTIPMMNTVAG